jgi:SAM-dependent methyltransferase
MFARVRACPYCNSQESRLFGHRLGHRIVRCGRCGSLFKDLTPAEFSELHAHAFTDNVFLERVVAVNAHKPDIRTWRQFAPLLPPGPLLEVGPGAGHVLAAARDDGREVYGLESSAVHRDFIRKTWGIETLADSPESLVDMAPPFAAVLAFNTIEHMYDLETTFRFLGERLRPGGTILVSTCNADCAILPLVGPYWAMLKVPDHVSIPSAEGLRKLGARTGLSTERVWTGEYPLETPIGILVAARDWWRERRGPAGGHSSSNGDVTQDPGDPDPMPSDGLSAQRRILRRTMELARGVDPSYRLTARLGRAAAIRGLFRKPS